MIFEGGVRSELGAPAGLVRDVVVARTEAEEFGQLVRAARVTNTT